ncbi:MAG: cupin domain-containing protein [Acidimicrobiia bacterium]
MTGNSPLGSSIVVADEQVESMDLGQGSLIDLFWALDGEAVLPNDGSLPELSSWFPEPGGLRVFTWVKQPLGAEPALAETAVVVGGLGLEDHYEAEHPGMHTSRTVDVNIIVSGELWLVLDDGGSTHLKAGDVVIQNGTRHKWENRSDHPTTCLSVTVGARLRDH